MALLEIAGLAKRFGPVPALGGIDLAVAAGELFVLLGGSGSGKTTLLRCIAGFERPDAGSIRLDGADLLALPPHRRPVNTMFQSYALFPHMSVAANVGFGLRQEGLPRAEIAGRVREMLDLVQMAAFGDRRPDQLSGGQRQRVALARALARRPRLLLLDEPLSALDRGLREQTRTELVGLQRRLGTTFVMVTHDQEEALATASRVGIMHEGRLVQVGPPAEVYERPATRFAAEFLGAANVFSGVVRAVGADGVVLERPGVGTIRAAGAARVGETVLVAVRPEQIAFGDAAGANRLAATVVDCAYRGESLAYVLRLEDGATIRVTRPLPDGAGGLRPSSGAAVTLSYRPEACVLLRE